MANPPRVKGTRAESAAARWLTDELGIVVTRGPLRGNADRGDLFGLPDTVIEVKNCKTPALKQWARELAAEMRNAGCAHGVILWSPPGVGMAHVDEWVALEWYPEGGGCQPGKAVPHVGPLGQLHKYVAVMDRHGYATFLYTPYLTVARLASSWLYEVRERLATPVLSANTGHLA